MYSLTATNHLFRDTDLIKGKTAENRIFPGGGEPKDQRLYADAENKAREGRLGLWRELKSASDGGMHCEMLAGIL
jgi:hypothetical protein